ncbi:MAG: pyruvate ferredoxin oxidoreductase [Desulfohalobiaceae bacterium]|nr:pyruvate ferredoxin oxidoreductase [Desulfohalobiaceae bacterium]
MLWNVTTVEYLNSGHLGCPGCGASLSMRHALKALGEKTVVVIPACCWSIIAGPFPTTALSVPLLHVPFATAAACASGVRRAMISQGRTEVKVMVWAGDGGTFDIGFQALSGAADRNEDFIYVCYDNEAYMNTGVQQSSATPSGAWTTTTPGGKEFAYQKKDLIGIVKAHHPAYMATANVAFPEDFYAKFEKAAGKEGFSFLHILAACPPGWKIDSQDALKVSRLAVNCGVFPLIELDESGELRQTYRPRPRIPVETYLRSQKRFKGLSDKQIRLIQDQVEEKDRAFGPD